MDEMDLVSKLKEVPPLRPDAYERARATLRTAMAQSVQVPAPARKQRFSWARNFRLGVAGKVGIGVVAAAAVAVAGVSLVSGTPAAPEAGTQGEAAPQPTVVSSKLTLLANDVQASNGTLSGDASLVIQNRTAPDGKPDVVYSLYTDSGEVYISDSLKGLSRSIAQHDTLTDPTDAHKVAAARAAAKGDVRKARDAMVNATPNAFGLGLSPAEAQQVWDKAQVEVVKLKREKGVKDAQPLPRPTGKALQDLINNSLWTNSTNALARGAANAELRTGVLRLIATIPDVTVADTNTDGQPTLTITAGPALFLGDGEQVLTINAKTGLPISSSWQEKSGKKLVETYKSSRVTLADIKAGKL